MVKTLGGRARWGIALLAATAVGALFAALFMLPLRKSDSPVPAMGRQEPGAGASVRLARPAQGDQILKDEALVRDLRPLFLPTEFNAAMPEPRREAGRSILDNDASGRSLTDGDMDVVRSLPAVGVIGAKAANRATATELLGGDDGAGVAGLGRSPRRIVPVGARGGFIEAISMSSGQPVLTQALPPAARPPTDKDWAPMELLAAVDAAGLVAPLAVTEGSRVDEVDGYFRRYLSQNFRLGERLPPGFYRIIVGP